MCVRFCHYIHFQSRFNGFLFPSRTRIIFLYPSFEVFFSTINPFCIPWWLSRVHLRFHRKRERGNNQRQYCFHCELWEKKKPAAQDERRRLEAYYKHTVAPMIVCCVLIHTLYRVLFVYKQLSHECFRILTGREREKKKSQRRQKPIWNENVGYILASKCLLLTAHNNEITNAKKKNVHGNSAELIEENESLKWFSVRLHFYNILQPHNTIDIHFLFSASKRRRDTFSWILARTYYKNKIHYCCRILFSARPD